MSKVLERTVVAAPERGAEALLALRWSKWGLYCSWNALVRAAPLERVACLGEHDHVAAVDEHLALLQKACVEVLDAAQRPKTCLLSRSKPASTRLEER